MKIECILMREGGTFAEIGGVTYHFAPSPEHGGRHVATVDHPVHAARFISITEGYRPLPEPAESARAAQEAPPAPQPEALPPAPPVAQPSDAPDLATMTREQMVDLHDQRFGRKPHHRLSDDKLRDLLAQPAAED